MSFPPKAFLIGAQKSGTTTLAYLLDQHPEISVSVPKEPHFFTHNYYKGIDWYKKQFSSISDDRLCLDASASYTMAPLQQIQSGKKIKYKQFLSVPEKIYSLCPQSKFIYLLRDPVTRTYSGYWHRVTNGQENLNFIAAINKNSSYLDISDYYGQLSIWLQYYPLDSFLILLFEDFIDNPEERTKQCFDFLNLKTNINICLDSPKNISKNVGKAGGIIKLSSNLLRKNYPIVHNTIKSGLDFFPFRVESSLKGIMKGYGAIPKLAEDDRALLIEYFRDRNRMLEGLISMPLNKWHK